MTRARLIRNVFVLAGLLVLTGCPYTEGCEALPVTAGPGTDAGPTPDTGTIGTPDGATGTDGAVDAGRDVYVPVGPIAPNCGGSTVTCAGVDCCSSDVVVGGTYNRSGDPSFPATVSDFKLDDFEVVVGRFRAFVNAGQGTKASPPAEGAGANPSIPGSGWQPAWNVSLAADTTDLVAAIKCNADYQPWTDAPGDNESRPMNCVTWFEAAAFCAWDGGWLPSEAEWNYAATGGDEQREFPWGGGIDDTRAVYGCTTTGEPNVRPCTFADYLPVGSKIPLGDGRWGQHDLAGSVWEWTFDWFADPYRVLTCVNCADLTPAEKRAFRGGAFNWAEFYQRTAFRGSDPPTARYGSIGFRCARPQ